MRPLWQAAGSCGALRGWPEGQEPSPESYETWVWAPRGLRSLNLPVLSLSLTVLSVSHSLSICFSHSPHSATCSHTSVSVSRRGQVLSHSTAFLHKLWPVPSLVHMASSSSSFRSNSNVTSSRKASLTTLSQVALPQFIPVLMFVSLMARTSICGYLFRFLRRK